MRNILREMRESMRLSRTELGALVGRSAPTIEKYESEIPEDLLRDLLDLAESRGLAMYAATLRRMLDGPVVGDAEGTQDAAIQRLKWLLDHGTAESVNAMMYFLRVATERI